MQSKIKLLRAAFASQNQALRGSANAPSSSSLRSCGRRLRRHSNPCRKAVVQEVRPASDIDSFAKTVA